jgi:hypothetical protein
MFLVIAILVNPQPSDAITAVISGPGEDTKCTKNPFSCMYRI